MKKHWYLIVILLLICGSVYTWIQILKIKPLAQKEAVLGIEIGPVHYSSIDELCQPIINGKPLRDVQTCTDSEYGALYHVRYNGFNVDDFYTPNFEFVMTCGALSDEPEPDACGRLRTCGGDVICAATDAQ